MDAAVVAIEVINQAGIPRPELLGVEHALVRQVNDADRWWHFGSVGFRRHGWRVTITPRPNIAARWAGRHFVTSYPYAIIRYTSGWTVALSHELLEMLARYTRLNIAGLPTEIGDPVTSYSYTAQGVSVSDYVLPSWFHRGSRGPWDRLGQLPGARTYGPRGYLAGA